MASSRLIALLDALLAAEVEFVVIDGLAAVLHGAPLVTSDVGIVQRGQPPEGSPRDPCSPGDT